MEFRGRVTVVIERCVVTFGTWDIALEIGVSCLLVGRGLVAILRLFVGECCGLLHGDGVSKTCAGGQDGDIGVAGVHG
jgi:hypothetical protein